jgi:L-seryl-tRNA(Ser) seleniumtransferase
VSLPAGYAEALRRSTPPVLGRVADGRCLLDLRALPPEGDATLRDVILATRDAMT